MGDNEIVKALECCANELGCEKCPANPHKGNYGFCTAPLIRSAFDLINRQKAEIERLKRKLVAYEPSVDSGLFSQMLLEQKEKAEAFEKKWKAEIKSEAYREFEERLKAKDEINNLGDGYVTIEDVTETYKELVGEDDA